MDQYYLDQFNAYSVVYSKHPIEDIAIKNTVQNVILNSLGEDVFYLDENNPNLSHFYFNSNIKEHLEVASHSGLCCPFCNSGKGSQGTGALNYLDNGTFHCMKCGRWLYPLSSVNKDELSLYIYNTLKIEKSQEEKQKFLENIDNYHKQLLFADCDFKEKKAFIEDVFTNRCYSDETIGYICTSELFHAKETSNGAKLYVSMFDTDLESKIGYQKLFYSHEENKLIKRNKGFLGYTLFTSKDSPNCIYIVESVSNALAIVQSGYNALCCYTSKDQPYKIYEELKRKGKNPILFLDRDIEEIENDCYSVNWKDIEKDFTEDQLKANADASDLLVLDSNYLVDVLRKTFNLYYKKQVYTLSQMTLEDAFELDNKIVYIQAEVGSGKTTTAVAKFESASNPLYCVNTKDACCEIGEKIPCNVVNSDNNNIDTLLHGVVTTHERTGINCELQPYAISIDNMPNDVAIIDECHKYFSETDNVIIQPYFNDSKEEDGGYLPIISNEQLAREIKEQSDIQLLAYKKSETKKATSPVCMARSLNTSDVESGKFEKVFLNKEYTVTDLTDPNFYDIQVDGANNVKMRKIDSNAIFWLENYLLNAPLETVFSYELQTIKELLKMKYSKQFKGIRNLYYPLIMPFFRNCYLKCAFPKLKGELINISTYKENVLKQATFDKVDTKAIFFKVHLCYINLLPLKMVIEKSKQLFLMSASDYDYKKQLIQELTAFYGQDFRYCNLQTNAIKEKSTTIIRCKSLTDDQFINVMQELSCIADSKAIVLPTYEKADEIYKAQKTKKINSFARATKDGFKIYLTDEIALERIDNKAPKSEDLDLIIHGNCPLLESSNKLARYRLMIIDCQQFAPKIAHCNPYYQDLGVSMQDRLFGKLQQQIGRLYRQTGESKVIILLNFDSVKFDLLSYIKAHSNKVIYYEDSKTHTYFNNEKDFVSNIQRALNGEDLVKFKCRKHRVLTSDEKAEKQAEKQAKKKEKALNMIANGATERELKQNIWNYKEKTAREWLEYNRETLAKYAPKGQSPFNEEVLNSAFVCFDTEVFPNAYVICFHSDKGNGFSNINPSYEWLCHFIKLPLVGFNNSNYDNPVLIQALRLLDPNNQDPAFYRFATLDFNTELKAFSDRIINKDRSKKDKFLDSIKYISQAIGLGDSQEMITKNIPGKSHDSIKCFMLDMGLKIKETPYSFDTVLTDPQKEDVVSYCMNDSLAVFYLIKKYETNYNSMLKLIEKTKLTGNHSKGALISEVIYDGKLTKKQRCQDNVLTIEDTLQKEFPTLKVLPGKKPKERYINEFEDMLYILGDGGFNLLESRVKIKVNNGSSIDLKPIDNNHKVYSDVLSLDIKSMHPHSIIKLVYFGEYTKNYKDILTLKDICSKVDEKGFEYVQEKLAEKGYYPKDKKDNNDLRGLFKIILNSTYGLTHMKYDSELKKCSHNLIALCGAWVISTLHYELVKRYPGIEIPQIKTDSIKIANKSQHEDAVNFCYEFARQYGYEFKEEDYFNYIVCNGNDFLATSKDDQMKNSLNDDLYSDESSEYEDEEDYMEKYNIEVKGSSFKTLYDDRRELRKKENRRSLLIMFKGKAPHCLGTITKDGKKNIINYKEDVLSVKVKYYLPVKKGNGAVPYYINKNGIKQSLPGLASQEVIPIYSLAELDAVDDSIIDYDFFQKRLDKALDKIINLMLEKRVDDEFFKKMNNIPFNKRVDYKVKHLTEEEKHFFNVLKNQLAFV